MDFSTTAALRASEALLVELIETREAAKVQNYLQGKAMLELYFLLTKVLTAYMAIHWQKPRISPIYGTPYLGKIIDLIANFPYMVYFTS